MKKEICIILFFFVLSTIFCTVANFWDIISAYISVGKEFILIILLILVQNQIINSLKTSFFASNPLLVKAKRKLFLFYTDTTEEFSLIYKNVSKIHTFNSVGFILAHIGISFIDDKNYKTVKKWLQKEERIPYDQLPEKVNIRTKLKIWNKTNSFQRTSEQFENAFFNCLTGKLLDEEKSQSIIELILIWLSYFLILIEVFSINLNDHLAVIITFFAMTIMDLSKHYITYKNNVKQATEGINSFYDQMNQMRDLIHDEDCLYVTIEGERVPYKRNSKF